MTSVWFLYRDASGREFWSQVLPAWSKHTYLGQFKHQLAEPGTEGTTLGDWFSSWPVY